MAVNPIRKEDIIDVQGITSALKELISLLQNDLVNAMQSVTGAAQQYKDSLKEANTTTKQGQAAIKETTEQTQKLNEEQARIIATQRELEKAQRAIVKAEREEIEVGKTAEGSYRRLALELRKLTAQWKDGDATVRSKLTPAIKKLDDELKRMDASIGKHQRNVGNYSSAWKGMGKSILSAAGIVGGAVTVLRTLFNVIKSGFKTTWDFEQQMSQVKAVSGATAEEFIKLRESAIALGGSTRFTATEVAKLQTEYAKLGFSASQILKMTSATLDLAAATGEDLAASANVAGSTLRGFGLDASKMQMVVDVMAESFNKSALDLNSFSTAMQQIAPVANAVGQTLQQATAKLSVLSNAGLNAEIAGTSLRNIYIELEQRGLSMDEALAKINNSTNKASVALDLFGKRGAVAGIILADNIAAANDFTDAYDNASGAAKEMAQIMEDNVKGSITRLKSSWEGLILRTNNSSGALQGFLDVLTNVISTINTKGKPAIDSMFETRTIENFGDKWKFYAQQGVGFWNTLGLAVFKGKRVTQEYSDAMSEVYAAEMQKENELLAEKERAELEKKRLHDEEIKRIEARVEAEEKAAKEKERLDKIGAERVKKYWEGQVAEAEKATSDNVAATAKGYTEQHKLELAAVDQSLATEEQKQQKLTEINEKYRGQRAEINKKEIGDALEIIGGGITAVGDLYEAQKQRELSAAGDNAKKREEIERKYHRKQQALAIAQAVINGAVAVTKVGAQSGILSFLTVPLIIAQTLAQVALIASQKFAKGGFTGRGRQKDDTGERVAGVVHENEFVLNKKTTKKYRPLIEAIHRDDKSAIVRAINGGPRADVWNKANELMARQDPFTEKMYNLMKETPVMYIDSSGNTVLKYPDGRKRIIKREKVS